MFELRIGSTNDILIATLSSLRSTFFARVSLSAPSQDERSLIQIDCKRRFMVCRYRLAALLFQRAISAAEVTGMMATTKGIATKMSKNES